MKGASTDIWTEEQAGRASLKRRLVPAPRGALNPAATVITLARSSGVAEDLPSATDKHEPIPVHIVDVAPSRTKSRGANPNHAFAQGSTLAQHPQRPPATSAGLNFDTDSGTHQPR